MTNDGPRVDVPYGLCHCGCGQKTPIATRSRDWNGRVAVKGEPTKFARGHTGRERATPEAIAALLKLWEDAGVSFGYCLCGCGELTNVAHKTDSLRGHIKGFPRRYVMGHSRRGRPGKTPSPVLYVVDPESGCWEWQRGRSADGYALASVPGDGSRRTAAHRRYYELHVGPIPDGLQIDHLCGNPGCVNPAHLEAVTPAENVRRGRKTKYARLSGAHLALVHSERDAREVAPLLGVHWSTVYKWRRADVA